MNTQVEKLMDDLERLDLKVRNMFDQCGCRTTRGRSSALRSDPSDGISESAKADVRVKFAALRDQLEALVN